MLDYADFLPFYPSIEDPSFQQQIYNKEEFYQLKLDRVREQISKGEYYRHQLTIARFLSTYTDYDSLLLFHEMGTGKSCAVFAMTEALKQNKEYKGCIVFARGRDVLTNLMRTFVFSCSVNYTVDKTAEAALQLKQIKRQLKNFYQFHTFLTFARQLAQLSNEAIEQQYSNMIFVIDEVHNIREKESEDVVYKQYHRLFHLTRNTKKLILSGTPMTDDPSELADTMNLLLPLTQQMPTGPAFVRAFLISQDDGTYKINAQAEGELKAFLRGRTSYLRTGAELKLNYKSGYFTSSLQYKDRPPVKGDIAQFRTVQTYMEPFQREAYLRAFREDTQGEVASIYSHSQQASLFVFPNGSWGEAGLKTYTTGGGLNKELLRIASNLNVLKQYSIKYAAVIQTILQQPKSNTYVYCSIVNGSGANLFCKILELYGYSRCTGRERLPAKRYILLTGSTPNIDVLINYFNQPKNIFGEYCHVIVGSKKISEAYTFNNVVSELILTYFWNRTETEQAIRRARMHADLEKVTGRQTVVSVMQLQAIADTPKTSIDALMMSFSQRKDVSIKRVERVIQETAIDCPLNYERNIGRINNSRECNYQACDYKCDTSSLERTAIDTTTYDLYYSNFMDLVPKVVQIFRAQNSVHYTTLKDILSPASDMILLSCLCYIIENNVILLNKYRYPCYLREEHDLYFLVGTPYAPFTDTHLYSNYGRYIDQPLISKVSSLDDITRELEYKISDQVLSQLLDTRPSTIAEFDVLLKKLPSSTIILFVKKSIETILQDVHTSSRYARYILSIYEHVIYFPEKSPFLAIYEAPAETLCVKKQGSNYIWSQCKATIPVQKERRVAVQEEKEITTQIPVDTKYLGIVQDEKFCIQDLSKTSESDKRRRTTGAVCVEAGWKKNRLLELIHELKISGSWEKRTKAEICAAIQQNLQSKGLIRRGKCGTARKVK